MTTVLDKELKRRITVNGDDYTIAIDPEGMRLIGKGKRTPDVGLLWQDLLSGDAAMAVALNASVSKTRQAPSETATDQPAGLANKAASKTKRRQRAET